MKLPENNIRNLKNKKQDQSVQSPYSNNYVDFSSGDYIGFSKQGSIFKLANSYLAENKNSVTNSLCQTAELFIAEFHEAESAVIFKTGNEANIIVFGLLQQQNAVILYDELCHATTRSGIMVSQAQSDSFMHNDFDDLECLIHKNQATTIYIVTEAAFSIDGDSPNLEELILLSEKYNCHLIISEDHSFGVFGEKGEGLLQYLNLHQRVFARLISFENSLACSGSVVLGSAKLKTDLASFAASFEKSAELSPGSIATILVSYQQLQAEQLRIENLRHNIVLFNQQKNLLGLKPIFVRSKSAIQSAIVPDNENVQRLVLELKEKGFDVKPLFSPTVPEGQERLRFCIHSYNSKEEINLVLELFRDFIF